MCLQWALCLGCPHYYLYSKHNHHFGLSKKTPYSQSLLCVLTRLPELRYFPSPSDDKEHFTDFLSHLSYFDCFPLIWFLTTCTQKHIFGPLVKHININGMTYVSYSSLLELYFPSCYWGHLFCFGFFVSCFCF